jgi:hypothetical protein
LTRIATKCNGTYVLDKFDDDEYKIVTKVMDRVKQCIEMCLSSNRPMQQIQQDFNRSLDELQYSKLLAYYKEKQAAADKAKKQKKNQKQNKSKQTKQQRLE